MIAPSALQMMLLVLIGWFERRELRAPLRLSGEHVARLGRCRIP